MVYRYVISWKSVKTLIGSLRIPPQSMLNFIRKVRTVYDRIDAAATINFSTQFGAATIRERRLFESGVYFVRRGYRLKKFSEKVNTSTRIVY